MRINYHNKKFKSNLKKFSTNYYENTLPSGRRLFFN